MSIDLSRVGVSGPLSARSRLIPPFCCTSSIRLCRRYSASYGDEGSFSDTGRHNLEVGIMEIAHAPVSARSSISHSESPSFSKPTSGDLLVQ
jgi:hypothetical protein